MTQAPENVPADESVHQKREELVRKQQEFSGWFLAGLREAIEYAGTPKSVKEHFAQVLDPKH